MMVSCKVVQQRGTEMVHVYPCLLYLRFLWLLSQDAMCQVKVFRAGIAC